MMQEYFAHTKENNGVQLRQTLKEHSENVAKLCADFTKLWTSKAYAENLGLLHDVGKYQDGFQQRLFGQNIKVEHSICGALECDKFNMMYADYCIAGHHSGLPDIGTNTDNKELPTLKARKKRNPVYDYSDYSKELHISEIKANPLKIELTPEEVTAKKELAFWIRMMFSGLVDADYLDTENFCDGKTDRGIYVDFDKCLALLKEKLTGFTADSIVKKARNSLLQQVLSHSCEDADLYYMNMPTGSGKTLAGIYFALKQAKKYGLKHIIYVIPYTSIIEQNAKVFKDIFGEYNVLEHHCNFDYDGIEDSNTADKLAHSSENWDASIIVTTNVQFFESIYGNKTSHLRKLHNMANSIIVFDEVHMLPFEYYQPCLEAIKILITKFHSKALFMTATMPNFDNWLNLFECGGIRRVNLTPDTSDFDAFKRCQIKDLSVVSVDKLISIAENYGTSLIVVNTKKAAKYVYEKLQGEKYHLSTYMTKVDRARVIEDIKQALNKKRCFVAVSTSLIEAGVDLDFTNVFRERAGLDNLLQTAGRCNREGVKNIFDCNAYAFDFEEANLQTRDSHITLKKYICKEIFDNFDSVNSPEAVRAYFDKYYNYYRQEMNKYNFKNYITACGYNFCSYAKSFKLIDDNSIGVIIEYADDEDQKDIIKQLPYNSRKAKRRLQKYVVSLKGYEFKGLYCQGVLAEKNGIYFLTNNKYYDIKTGIKFEDDSDCIY